MIVMDMTDYDVTAWNKMVSSVAYSAIVVCGCADYYQGGDDYYRDALSLEEEPDPAKYGFIVVGNQGHYHLVNKDGNEMYGLYYYPY